MINSLLQMYVDTVSKNPLTNYIPQIKNQVSLDFTKFSLNNMYQVQISADLPMSHPLLRVPRVLHDQKRSHPMVTRQSVEYGLQMYPKKSECKAVETMYGT